jgi:hypothetical protein
MELKDKRAEIDVLFNLGSRHARPTDGVVARQPCSMPANSGHVRPRAATRSDAPPPEPL